MSKEVSLSAGWPEKVNYEASDVITLSVTISSDGTVNQSSSASASASAPTKSVGSRLRGSYLDLQELFPGLRGLLPDPPDRPQVSPSQVSSQVSSLRCDATGLPSNNYRGFLKASLHGSAFDIAPQEALRKPFDLESPDEQILEWVWSITPERGGQHKIYMDVIAEWDPGDDDEPALQCGEWGQVLDIEVTIPFVAKNEIRGVWLLSVLVGLGWWNDIPGRLFGG
jgi:hypothetical protein